MREIKFRAWDTNAQPKPRMFYSDQCKEGLKQFFEVSENQDLMQFTGLKDKNGKEIYEGDILKCYGLGVVKFYGGEYALETEDECFIEFGVNGETSLGFTSQVEREIIGNIYENPELLNN